MKVNLVIDEIEKKRSKRYTRGVKIIEISW